MNDREVKIRELLERRADGFPSYHRVPPKLIARARRSMVTTALAVCLIGSGLGYGAFAGVRAIGRAVVPASPTPSTKPVPSPSETAAASPSPSPIEVKGLEVVFPLDGSVSEVKVGDGGLYAAYTPTRDGDHQLIARLDLRTGAVKESAPLPPGVSLALAGGSLWVTHWKGSNSEVRVLARLDPHTLAVRATVPIPGWSSELAPAPAGLWVGSGTGGYLLDPSDGRVLRSVKLDGQAGAMSVDPSGRLLYVVTSVPGAADPRSLYELDAATGGVRARVALTGVAVNGISATGDGVWVSVATGMLGRVGFHRASDLRVVAAFGPQRNGPATNGIRADVVDGILWVTDSMVGAVACADPATGRPREIVIAQSSGIAGYSNVAGAGAQVYLGIDRGVARITPSPRCRG